MVSLVHRWNIERYMHGNGFDKEQKKNKGKRKRNCKRCNIFAYSGLWLHLSLIFDCSLSVLRTPYFNNNQCVYGSMYVCVCVLVDRNDPYLRYWRASIFRSFFAFDEEFLLIWFLCFSFFFFLFFCVHCLASSGWICYVCPYGMYIA